MRERLLDIENIGRIGQMFLDGDLLKKVMIDPFTCDEDDTDYDIPAFNALKAALSKVERMNPDLYLTGALWQWYPTNRRMAAPAVIGKAHPRNGWMRPDPPVGWMITDCAPEMLRAMQEGTPTKATDGEGKWTYYFPIKTSAGVVVGALELSDSGKPGPYERNYTMNA